MTQPSQQLSLRERLNISRIAIQYPWLTVGFWIAITVAGIFAFSSLKYALLPDITFPVVVVNAAAPLPTTLETEQKLTAPIEQSLQALKEDGLDKISSSTYTGRSIISLSFAVGTSLDTATSEVNTRLRSLRLPDRTDFTVTPVNLNESTAISYAIGSNQRSLAQVAETVQKQVLPEIARIPGVRIIRLLGVPTSASTQSFNEKDKAEITIQAPGTSAVRFNGQDVLALDVIKRGDANTLEVVQAVETKISQLQTTLPTVKFQLAAAQAGYIREATQATIEALLLAIALSIVVIFPFLWNWKATLISALAIPTSLLGTFIVMATLGFRLETITLLALALIVGIIVDDAIVDVENISRHLEKGEPPRSAVINATNEIGLTVTAATLTIVAVFLPIGLMSGVVGQFFKPFGITVSAAVLISLLVARTLSPVLALYWMRAKQPHSNHEKSPNFLNGYRHILRWSLKHRWVVVMIALLSFGLGIGLLPFIPKGFIPKLDRGEFNITYTVPLPTLASQELINGSANPATPVELLASSVTTAQKLEATVLKSPQVQSVFTAVGTGEGQPNQGTLHVTLRKDRTVDTATVEDQIRQQLPSIPGGSVSVEDIQFVETGGSQKPLQIVLLGDGPYLLSQTAKNIQSRIEKLPEIADVTVTGGRNTRDMTVEIDRLDSRRVAYISANLQKGVALGDATDRVVAIANQVKPSTVSLDLEGDSKQASDVFSTFGVTAGLSMLCIFLVLILLFQSWSDPLVILFSLPLSIVGALIAALVTHSNFGIISAIGIIFLLGLTNKNAILLVDYINQLRRAGRSRTAAILLAGPVRLRPILMTTSAMILGMLPIALGWGAGAELRAPMAIAVIGGLVTSTLLSLLVVPVVYTLLDDFHHHNFGQRKLGLSKSVEQDKTASQV
jgi:multidrug efflux pump subunit AcrB